jgi:hypothetical protein
MSSTCHNCGGAKTPEFYSEHYCADCTKAVEDSRKFGIEKGLDLGTLKREALGQRASTTHNNRPNPRTPMTKADYWNAQHPTGAESEQ